VSVKQGRIVAHLIHLAQVNWGGLPAWVADAYERGDIIFLPHGLQYRSGNDWTSLGPYDELSPSDVEARRG
jgi:hypothetical protein